MPMETGVLAFVSVPYDLALTRFRQLAANLGPAQFWFEIRITDAGILHSVMHKFSISGNALGLANGELK